MKRCLAALAAALLLAAGAAGAQPPSFASFRAAQQASDVVLEDRGGRPLGSLRTSLQARRLGWVRLADISPAMVEALLVAEDQRFFRHAGVDWVAAAGALWQQTTSPGAGRAPRGASTISMQVAALLQPALARGAAPRSWERKWDQAQAALALETAWSKTEILEAYLNTVSFRGELQGLQAASHGLFHKAPSGLDREESAVLAALVRAPAASPLAVARRACAIVARTRGSAQGCDVQALADRVRHASLAPQVVEPLAPHAARRLLADGKPVRSSIDADLQRSARDALQAQLAQLTRHGVEDGAVVVLDNRSGQVLAYVGSSGAFSRAAQVDAADAPRQAGSTLKPFLYAIALQRQLLTPATVLDDSPVAVATDAGVYAPRNYDLRFLGPVSVRRALGSSLNVPAVRAIGITGAPALHQLLLRLGVASLHPLAEHYGDSLALGSADVTLLALTNAYRALANGGEASALRWGAGDAAAPRQRVIDAASAWLVADILSDNAARESTFGFDSVLATPFWTAVKTGTSKDMRDNWCIGFSEHYTVGVWVGNASGAAMRNVSGVSGAAPAWADIMRGLHQRLHSRQSAPPAGVVARAIAYEGGIEPPRNEWFLAATAPAPQAGGVLLRLQSASGKPRIVAPQPGSLIAWDPDMPSSVQGILARHTGEAADPAPQWVLNGQVLGAGPQRVLPLQAGRNVLVLRGAGGAPLDQLTYEVRGMPRPR